MHAHFDRGYQELSKPHAAPADTPAHASRAPAAQVLPIPVVRVPPACAPLAYVPAGARAALAAKTLLYIGYKDVFNLGGFKEWVENGGEIEVI